MPIYDIILSMILPVTFIVIGRIFWKHPPGEINMLAGWRTKEAMRSEKSWDFANRTGGKMFFWLGMTEFVATLIAIILLWRSRRTIQDLLPLIFVLVQAVLLIPGIFRTEQRIREFNRVKWKE